MKSGGNGGGERVAAKVYKVERESRRTRGNGETLESGNESVWNTRPGRRASVPLLADTFLS